MEHTSPENVGSVGNKIYRIGGVAALICALMYFITLGIYITAYRTGSPPSTIQEWLAVFQSNPITGLFFLGLADIIIMILWGPMSLALYEALKGLNRTWALIATVFIFVGIAVYLATNIAFSMVSLSHQYAAATTEVEKAAILAAGRAIIAISEGTGGQYTGMPLAWLAGLILSVIMLGSRTFNKATAWAGIVGLGLLLASVPFAGYTTPGTTAVMVNVIVAVTYMGGGLLSLAWYILIGIKLLKLGQTGG